MLKSFASTAPVAVVAFALPVVIRRIVARRAIGGHWDIWLLRSLLHTGLQAGIRCQGVDVKLCLALEDRNVEVPAG